MVTLFASSVIGPATAATIPTKNLHLYAETKPTTSALGTVTEHTLHTSDGLQRTYRLFVPVGLSGKAPLLVALHGGLGSGLQFELASGFDGLATSNRFIVAYPDGVTRFADGSGGARTWNGGKCCGPAVTRNIDDVAFLRAVVKDVASLHPIDRSRVYAVGHSNGGIMALRLACEASDVFAAVGAQSATLEVAACAPRRPVSAMQIHGTADTNIPIAGGKGSGVANFSFSPPRKAARTLAKADGCRARPAQARDAANGDLILSRWRSCPRGISVEFLTVEGAGHAWMGRPSTSAVADDYMGKPYQKLDSSRALWAFLSAHPRAT